MLLGIYLHRIAKENFLHVCYNILKMGLQTTTKNDFLLTVPFTQDITYKQKDNCYFSKWQAFLLFLATFVTIFFIAIISYNYGVRENIKISLNSNLESVVETKITASKSIQICDYKVRFQCDQNIRLPDNVIPLHYKLQIQAYIDEPIPTDGFTLKGRVLITIRATSPGVNEIVLNSKSLIIDKQTVTVQGPPPTSHVDTLNVTMTSQDLPQATDDYSVFVKELEKKITVSNLVYYNITNQEYETDTDKYRIYLESPLIPDVNYTLAISFKGTISDGTEGFFYSDYFENNTKTLLAITHFEATSARMAFPCFDEPALKAQFEISICRQNHLTSLSNMPLIRSHNNSDQPGWTWDHFDVSVPMSTYLVAFTVSDYVAKETISSNNVTIRVWMPREIIHKAEYAVSVAPKILDFLTDYFGIPYPLPKLDIFGTRKFSAGAMENWGLTIYMERTITNPPKAKNLELFRTIQIISHEFGHQWFGNLVTMKWWTDLWLNEGFATYIEYLATDAVEPTWNIFDIFIARTLHYAMDFDIYHSTHPVSVNVTDPTHIDEIFDSISYKKGGSIIRMLNHSLTEPLFKKGLYHYLQTWKYKNAEQDDLWDSFTLVAKNSTTIPHDVTIKEIMDSWTLQEGYPLITVTRDYKTGSATIAQKRLLIDNASDDKLWYVPLSYQTFDDQLEWSTAPKAWLKKEKSITIQNLTSPSSWVIFNVMQTGFYRVNYDPRNWLMIQNFLMSSAELIPVTTRIQLLSDAMELAKVGQLNYSIALNLALYLPQKETHYLPFKTVLQSLLPFYTSLIEFPIFELFQKYLLELISPKFHELGTKNKPEDSYETTSLRTLIINWACFLEDPGCIDWAKQFLTKLINGSQSYINHTLSEYTRDQVLCTGLKHATKEDFNKFFTLNISDDDFFTAKFKMCNMNISDIHAYLHRIESNERLHAHESYPWRSMEPITSVDLAFKYLAENWQPFLNKYKQSHATLKLVLQSVLWNLHSDYQLEELSPFQNITNTADPDSVDFRTGQFSEKEAMKLRWMKNCYPELQVWLEKRYEKQNFTSGSS